MLVFSKDDFIENPVGMVREFVDGCFCSETLDRIRIMSILLIAFRSFARFIRPRPTRKRVGL